MGNWRLREGLSRPMPGSNYLSSLLCVNGPFPNRLTHFYGRERWTCQGLHGAGGWGVGATGLPSFERGDCISPLRDLGSLPNSEFSSPPSVPGGGGEGKGCNSNLFSWGPSYRPWRRT